MARHTWLIALTLFTSAGVGLRGQGGTPAPAAGSVVAVGCLERAQRNGSLAGTAVGTSASPNTAPQEANSSEPTNRFMLTGVSEKGADPAALRSYALEGREQELANHTGHRVEVTGSLTEGNTSARGDARSQRTAAGVQRLRVESFKMVSASCAAR